MFKKASKIKLSESDLRQNALQKIWLALGLGSALLLLGGQFFFGRLGLLFGFFLALGLNTVVFFYGDLRLLRMFETDELEGQDPWGLLALSQEFATRAEIPTPRVILLRTETPTSMSVATSMNNSAILISTGLLQALGPTELRCVIAFEIARTQNLDSIRATIGSALASGVLFVSSLLDTVLLLGFLRKDNRLHWFQDLAAPLISLLVHVAHSKESFFRADARASEWIGDKKLMARVLSKLESFNATQPLAVALADAQLFIVNPLTSKPWTRYFWSHPLISERVRRLVGYFPL